MVNFLGPSICVATLYAIVKEGDLPQIIATKFYAEFVKRKFLLLDKLFTLKRNNLFLLLGLNLNMYIPFLLFLKCYIRGIFIHAG